MDLEKVKYIYFLGIGGIGMSALARYFHAKGISVSGYDRTPTSITNELIEENIPVHFEDNVSFIDSRVKEDKTHTLVVITPAVPKDHSELIFFRENGFEIRKRSEVLGMITKNHFTIAVAGTHGKTTTSCMIAHLLKESGVDCTAFLGGISKNYNSNILIPSDSLPSGEPVPTEASGGKGGVVVVEADEYDRSFLTLHPDVAVITSMDADHLDIYGSSGEMNESYRMFASQTKPGGTLIHRNGLPLENVPVTKKTYSIGSPADYEGKNITVTNHRFHFDWVSPEETITNLYTSMPGRHNVENAVAAVAAARQMDIRAEQISSALKSFQGVKRRFDYQLESEKLVFIDDYAHHPEELKAAITAARELYPGWKVCGIFQPHLYSRTRDFADGFASSLSLLDELLLLEIYPARELPIRGVDSKMIFNKVSLQNKALCSRSDVLDKMKNKYSGVVLTLGAGDIDQLVEPVRVQLGQNLKNKNHEAESEMGS